MRGMRLLQYPYRKKVSTTGARKFLHFAGLGLGAVGLIAAAGFIVFLSGSLPQTNTGPRSGRAQEAETPQLKAEQDKAAANPLVLAASLPKESRPARIVRQANAMSSNGLDNWLVAFETAGTAESRQDVFLFLTDFNRLYDTTKFRDDESAKLISRMKIVPKAEIDIWNEALAKSVGGQLIPPLSNDSAALVVIIQQDLLFKEQGFDHAMSKVLCQRLATIPKSAIEEVTGIGKQYSALEGTDAALAIAKYDPLFVDNVFQPQVWQALKR